MSKQWGHGFHKGIESAQAKNKTLVGLWFHSRKNGKIAWQGRIDREMENDRYVVQLFEWFMGEPIMQKIISFDEMKEWDFYPSGRAMRYAWHVERYGSDEDFELNEKVRASM